MVLSSCIYISWNETINIELIFEPVGKGISPSLMSRVWSLESTWWKERSEFRKLFSDLHTWTVMCAVPHTQTFTCLKKRWNKKHFQKLTDSTLHVQTNLIGMLALHRRAKMVNDKTKSQGKKCPWPWVDQKSWRQKDIRETEFYHSGTFVPSENTVTKKVNYKPQMGVLINHTSKKGLVFSIYFQLNNKINTLIFKIMSTLFEGFAKDMSQQIFAWKGDTWQR